MKKLKLNRQTITHLASTSLAAAVGAGSGSRQGCISGTCNTCHLATCNCSQHSCVEETCGCPTEYNSCDLCG
jgi:hypothetical protein